MVIRMSVFVVRELEHGVLISLSSLVRRLPVTDIAEWLFRDVELHGIGTACNPFGFRIPEFEELTKRPTGYRVSRSEFEQFLSLDLQFIDGTIDGFRSVGDDRHCVSIRCEDAAQWEIATDSIEMIKKLRQSGLSTSS